MTALLQVLHDAVQWIKGEQPPTPEPEPEPTRLWLREQEVHSRRSAQQTRDYLEALMVERRDLARKEREEG